MSFPNKSDRQRCWNAKDKYWECLEASNEKPDACLQLRKIYESNCPSQWVSGYSTFFINVNIKKHL